MPSTIKPGNPLYLSEGKMKDVVIRAGEGDKEAKKTLKKVETGVKVESNARITAKKAMRGEAPKTSKGKRAVRAAIDKSPSKQKKVPLDVAADVYENRKWKPVVSEATDDMGRTIPGSGGGGKKKTIGKFRSQPGAGPGQAERNAEAKKKAEAEAQAKTAHGDTNEARGIGGKWDTPSQKYSANRMRDFTPPTPEQVKKERERRLKAGLNADGSKKTKTEGMKRLTRVGNAKIKKRGGILNVGSDDKEMNTQFKKERENQVGGDARNTGTKVRATLGTPEGKHRMARKRDQHESTEHQISQLDTSTPVGAARAKELKIRQKARHLDAKDAEAGKRQGYKVDSEGRPLKGQRVRPATPAAARAAQNKADL